VAVDAVLWHGAGLELLAAVAAPQYLVRALLFRLLSERDPTTTAAGHRSAVDYVSRIADG
jgi:hypothetical protein